MATETLTDPRKKFTPRILPWLLAAAIFVIYALTINHWVSLFNLSVVAKTSGWTWQAEMLQPVFYAVTWPFRWLPAAKIPIALNLFSAGCAALTLGLLARSVAILPHDRTDAQRQREKNDFSFLTIGGAWLPPLFAVAVCGLQMTFWEQATNCTGEMFDLLLFAFVIWSLLEYRLDEREGRLFLAAAVYGAGMADDWALVGFFPIFIAAIVWIRGLRFFNFNFLTRMAWCGLAGMLFYLLLPLVAATSHATSVTFWQALKFNLSTGWNAVELFFTRPQVRFSLALLSPASLLPVLLLAIRWKSSFGDDSKIGQLVANFMFHLIHALLLFVCVWVAFDPPISPRNLVNLRNINFVQPFLTFYYLGALSTGYFTGYFLLVFGKKIESEQPRRRKQFSPDDFVNRTVLVATWLFAGIAVTGLAYKNFPQIRSTNDDTFKKFAALTVENLPRNGGIVLSDDWRRLMFAQAALAQDGRAKNFVLADTAALPAPAYHHYLHKQFPDKWPDTVTAAEITNGISPMHLIGLLATLAKTNELYYLHPSFGYYFELFCMEPHGLVYKLNLLPNDTLLSPLPDKNLVAANEAFWAQAGKTALEPILHALAPRDFSVPKSFGEQLLDRFHVPREPAANIAAAGIFYSRSLDFWGVQQQRAGDLARAAAHFEMAQKLNPDNVVASINLKFNQSLRAGKIAPVDLSQTAPDKFGKHRSWGEMLNSDGPFDDPSFCFKNGVILMQGSLSRQAVEPFERVRQLEPDYLPARLWLAQCYLTSRLPDLVLATLRGPLENPKTFLVDETNALQMDLLAAAADFQKNDNAHAIRLIESEISRQPTNDSLLVIAAQMYVRRGLFTNALTIIDRKLRLAPDDPNWLFGKGYASIQIGAYNEAIAALTHLLAIQTNSNDARFNRAVAYLQSGNLDAARADYLTLQHSFTNSLQVAYGLGEIAWRKHDTNEAIKNYEIYLANANTNTAEFTNIVERYKSLKH